MQITKYDIALALYGEVTDEISRGNNSLVEAKIQVGIGEVYGYLHRYDTDTIFGEEWEEDLFLKQLCVNIIAWHLITLCTPNVAYDVVRQNYEDAKEYLKGVQKGTIRPNWPLRPDDPETNIDDAGNIQWNSNKKRNNHY